MSLIDDIKAGFGFSGPTEVWAVSLWGDGSSQGYRCNVICDAMEAVIAQDIMPQDAARIARVPDMEAALLAADELAQAVAADDRGGNGPHSDNVSLALAAYRQATGEVV